MDRKSPQHVAPCSPWGSNAGEWVPANGGAEQPFHMRGRRLLYCFNPASGNHAYIDVDVDMVLSDDEVRDLFLHH